MPRTTLLGSRAIGVVVALYIALVVVASIHFNISLTADRVAVLLVIAALGTGRIRSFLRDWSAFVIVVLAWQVLQGMSHTFTHFRPHVSEMISVDRFLFFGHVPTVWLQHSLYHPGRIAWYDIGATILYMLHFVLPLGFAFALWFWRRPIFIEFMASFLLLALAGFATFVLFPAAPPWIAADWWHRLPHVYRIFDAGARFLGGSQSYSTLTEWAWHHGGWDEFGAVPSEHAAFPFLCFLYARQAWKRAGWILLPYCAAVGVAVVYLGEHYVADVIVGAAYAGIAYAVVQVWLARQARREAAVLEQTSSAAATDQVPA